MNANWSDVLRDGAVWLSLDDGLIAVTGEDSETFLQGQLTNDVRRLADGRALYAGMCNPKGRLLASFMLWRTPDTIYLRLPAEMQAAIQKRLGMYVLRSKVRLQDARGDWRLAGVAGATAAELLSRLTLPVPQQPMTFLAADDGMVVNLGHDRFLLALGAQRYDHITEELAANTMRIAEEQWRWLDIMAGIPVILPATQEEFVPQMVNFDLTGAVDFRKGCYTGQEIVARMQYLGRLKRRMYRVHTDDTDLQPGQPVYSADMTDPTGMVVLAAPAPEGGWDALVVEQIASAGQQMLHVGSPDGPVLAMRELPYVVGEPVV